MMKWVVSRGIPRTILKSPAIGGDIVAICVIPSIILWMTGGHALLQIVSFGASVVLAHLVVCLIVGLYQHEPYQIDTRHFLDPLFIGVTSYGLVIIIWFAARHTGIMLSWRFIIIGMGSGLVGQLLFRTSLAWRYRGTSSGRARGKRVAIVGSPADAWIMRTSLEKAERCGEISLMGTVELGHAEVDAESIVTKLVELNPEYVIVTGQRDALTRAKVVFDAIKDQPMDVLTPINVMPAGYRQQVRLGGVSLARVWANPFRGWRGGVKRGMDLVIGIAILLLALPLMGVIAAMIRFDSPGPALIRQRRFGYANRPIEVFKFRTMHWDKGDLSGARATRRNDSRVTGLGRLLRATSLDELPQLFNVLRGNMSLVGPRPHPIEMQVCGIPYYDAVPDYLSRHRVKPGITGLAQISGCRGSVETMEQAERRLNYDLEYINQWSPMLDIRILWRTVFKGFVGERAY